MANEVQTGKAVVFGVTGTVSYTGIGTIELQTGSFDDRFDLHETRDKQGEVIGLQAWNPLREVTLNFTPVSSATGAGAINDAKLGLALPSPLASVSLTNFAHADLTGTWIYIGGGRIDLSNQTEGTMTLPCRKYNTDISGVATST
jgi:hypothetical protein